MRANGVCQITLRWLVSPKLARLIASFWREPSLLERLLAESEDPRRQR